MTFMGTPLTSVTDVIACNVPEDLWGHEQWVDQGEVGNGHAPCPQLMQQG